MNKDSKELKADQIKVGSNKVMSYNERLEWLKSSELGKLYGFKQEKAK